MADNILMKKLKEDKNLAKNKNKKMNFISLATMFLDDFRNNLELTSLDLDDKYTTGDPDGWRSFLSYPPVKSYINDFTREVIDKQASNVLQQSPANQRDAVATKKLLAESEEQTDNSHIVVVFMPQKDYSIG